MTTSAAAHAIDVVSAVTLTTATPVRAQACGPAGRAVSIRAAAAPETGPPAPDSLVIDTPWRQPCGARVGYRLAMLLLWAFWTYLWLPLATLAAWLFGVHLFHDNMVRLGGWHSLASQLHWYGLTVTAIVLAWLGWVAFNCRLHRLQARRDSVAAVTHFYDEARFFDVAAEDILAARRSRRIVVEFPEEGGESHLRLTATDAPDLQPVSVEAGDAVPAPADGGGSAGPAMAREATTSAA